MKKMESAARGVKNPLGLCKHPKSGINCLLHPDGIFDSTAIQRRPDSE